MIRFSLGTMVEKSARTLLSPKRIAQGIVIEVVYDLNDHAVYRVLWDNGTAPGRVNKYRFTREWHYPTSLQVSKIQ